MLQVFRDEGNLPRPFQIKCQGSFKAKGSPGFFCSTSFFFRICPWGHRVLLLFSFSPLLYCLDALKHSCLSTPISHNRNGTRNENKTRNNSPISPLSWCPKRHYFFFFTFDIMNDNWGSRKWKWLPRAVTEPKLLNYANSCVLFQQGNRWKLRSQIVSTEVGAQQTFVILLAWLSLASFNCTERKIFH